MLVVDGGGSLRSALVGDLIAGIAVQRGWAGLIISGAVRDSVALDLLDLGIKALGTNPQKSSKTGDSVVNSPVEIGGVWIMPGQTVHSTRTASSSWAPVINSATKSVEGTSTLILLSFSPLDPDREDRT